MSRYRIQPADRAYVAEFLACPIGYHSPGLQRLLDHMRGGPLAGKYVLIVIDPYRKWALGRLPGVRGGAVETVAGVFYTDRLDAERDVFRRRWRDLTGEQCPDGA